tara:strand:+ start:242 stop:529 length:288 start_codon:yes stop_codon:yes gene_type:complete
MSINKNTVSSIAKLARIRVNQEDLSDLSSELTNIFTWIEQLNSVDTENIDPMTSVVDSDLYKRADLVSDGGYQKQILSNAPSSMEGFFVVPKVVE